MGLSFWENFWLSGTAAGIGKTAGAPIERVKLLIQNQDEMLKSGRLDKRYSGMIECTVRTYKTEGLYNFWRGNSANVIRYFPTQALNFAFKDQIQGMFNTPKTASQTRKFATNIASGGLAGSLSLLGVYSLDYARTRLGNDAMNSSGQRQYSGLADVYRQTLKTDGLAGLYRGFVISVVGIFIYRGLYFGLYDSCKPLVFKGQENPSAIGTFFLSLGTTSVAGIVAYPIDTLRRRMMMTSGEAAKYNGSIDAYKKIVAAEGHMSLMKGAWVNTIRGASCALVLVGFDKFKYYYTAYMNKSK